MKKNKKNFKRINKIGGYKNKNDFAPFYIGKMDKKKRTFGFIDPISDEELLKIKNEVDMSYFVKKEKYAISNIKSIKDGIYVSNERIGTANDGDIVLVQLTKYSTPLKKDGVVKYILKRQKNTVVGTFQLSAGFGFVVPDDKTFISDIFIPKKEFFGAKDQDKVVVEITKYVNDRQKNSEGRITKIVARKGENYLELKSLLAENEIEPEFSEEVKFEAMNIPTVVTEKEMENRVDLRNIYTYTIDGEDAKDLDDAISIEKKQNYIVYISIADVSHYVKENMFMDKEALKRGNSIYLIDTVVPMLPVELSNEICSLNAGQDRLAFTVKAEIDNEGQIISYDIFKSVIKVDRRMSYKEVQDILDKKIIDKDVNDFVLLEKLTKVLIKRRSKNGYIEFDIPETEIILDDKGVAIDIKDSERYFSNKIIEHLMLTANEITAEVYNKLDLPIIYRVHETPDPERVSEINEQLSEYGLKINVFKRQTGDLREEKYIPQKEYIRILKEIEAKKEKQEMKIKNGEMSLEKDKEKLIDFGYISYMLLRSMRKAKYSEQNLGHYGIGSKYYSHFTAPIRRYSDIFTHRIISKYLENKEYFTESRKNEYLSKAKFFSEIVSETERLAQELERKYTDIKISEYISNFVGEIFDGIVVSKTPFGIFVNIGKEIEGLVKAETFEKEYRVGQKVKVRVENVNKELRTN